MTLPVAVTGASGFVGRALIEHLIQRGHSVRAIVRTADQPPIPGADVRVVPDFSRSDLLRSALASCACVFHLAGRAHQGDSSNGAADEEFSAGIVIPAAAVALAVRAEAVRSLVVVSSVAALCGTSKTPISDASPEKPVSSYGRAKLEADHLVLREGAEGRFNTVVLRPPALYGPGMKGNPLRLFQLVSRGFPLPVGAIHNRRSMMSVGNLASACTAAWTSGLSGAYVVADREAHSTAEWARRIAGALGVRARLWTVPVPMLQLGARVAALGALGGMRGGSAQFDRLIGSLEIQSDAFHDAIGPALAAEPEAEALARAASWFRMGAHGA